MLEIFYGSFYFSFDEKITQREEKWFALLYHSDADVPWYVRHTLRYIYYMFLPHNCNTKSEAIRSPE